MGFYKVSDNVDTVFASDVDQLVDALSGANDVGQISLFAPIAVPSAPTVAVNTTAGNLTGAYKYAVAFVTGYWKGAVGTGTMQTDGNTGGGTVSASVSPSAQQINLTAIPVGPAGTIARIIYRTKAGGSTYFQVTQINDNTTTAYTDNTADASITVAMPTTNTTGTNLVVGNAFNVNQSTNAITTKNNTLDDGSGAIFSLSNITIGNSGAANAWSRSLILNALNASSVTVPSYIQADGTGKLLLNATGIAGAGTAVATKNNTLDDGSGGASFAGQVNFRTTANTGAYSALIGQSPDGSYIGILPSAGASSYNPLVGNGAAGDQAIIFNSKGASTNASFLTIAPWSGTKSGIRIGSDATVKTANNTLDDGSGNLNVHGYGFVNGYINPTAMGASTQGIGFGWNYSGGTGEADIFCYGQGGTGGLKVYNTNQAANNAFTKIFDIDGSGNVTIPGTLTVNGQAVGNNVGDLSQYINRISYDNSSLTVTTGQTLDLVNVTGKGYVSLAALNSTSTYSCRIVVVIDGVEVLGAYASTNNQLSGVATPDWVTEASGYITVPFGGAVNGPNAAGSSQLNGGSTQTGMCLMGHPLFFNTSLRVYVNQGSGQTISAMKATVKGAYK